MKCFQTTLCLKGLLLWICLLILYLQNFDVEEYCILGCQTYQICSLTISILGVHQHCSKGRKAT